MSGARLMFALVLGLATGALAGCRDDGGLACDRVQPCGGDIVGTWGLAEACAAQPPVPGELCAAATVVSSSYTLTGAATFDADLSYVVDGTESATVEVSVPGACLMFGGQTVTCAQITPQTLADVDVRCVEANDGCLCTFILLQRPLGEKGTYITSGTLLTDTPSKGEPAVLGYCVQGQRLHVITPDSKMTTPSSQPGIAGDVVGVKK